MGRVQYFSNSHRDLKSNSMSTTSRSILFCTTLHVGEVYDSLLKIKNLGAQVHKQLKKMAIMSQKLQRIENF